VPAPTATPKPAGPRPKSEWTADEPATLEELEAELENHRGESFTLASWGGGWQAAIHQGAIVPFVEKFGIEVIEDSPVELAKMRAMAETGNVTWDVVDSGTRWVYTLGIPGYLEELDPAIHNGYVKAWPEIAQTPWSAGPGVLWSTGLAYTLESFPDHEGAPKTWADFWDPEGVPGRRSLGDRPNENVVFALMAKYPEKMETNAGKLSLSSLSDADLDEAFEMLEQIKPDIQIWWHSGTDCPQLLISGELDMCSAWNGRIWNAQQDPTGSDLYYCYECGHINQTDVFYIIKGAPKKDLAELFLAWAGQPQNAIELSRYITYGPISSETIPLVPEVLPADLVDVLPTSPIALGKMIVLDELWLGSNLDAGQGLVERFQAFLQE
jgi:putative spermidine/putrescine transport system substrate-binding protein